MRKYTAKYGSALESIGVDTWGVDYGFLKKDGSLLEIPYQYRDDRTNGTAEIIDKAAGNREVYDITGIQFMTINTLNQMAAVKRDTPERLEEAHDMLFIGDLLHYFLSGEKAAEFTVASTSQMLDAFKKEWSHELFEQFGIPDQLKSKIVFAGDVIGTIDPKLAKEVGLNGTDVYKRQVQYVPQLPAAVAILIGMGVGIGCGAVNGVLVAKGRIIPIIATLGMMNVFRGLTYLISGSKWVSAHQMSDGFKSIATSGIGPINTLIIIAVVVVLIFYYFLNYNRTGRYIYAVGSNPESAVITGIKKDRILIMSYTLLGLLTGMAGVLWVAKFASAQGDTATGYEMNVIAACVLGGVSVSGGTGKVGGLLLGVLLLGVLQNACLLYTSRQIQGCVNAYGIERSRGRTACQGLDFLFMLKERAAPVMPGIYGNFTQPQKKAGTQCVFNGAFTQVQL